MLWAYRHALDFGGAHVLLSLSQSRTWTFCLFSAFCSFASLLWGLVVCPRLCVLACAVSVRWEADDLPPVDELFAPPVEIEDSEGFGCAYAAIVGVAIEILSLGAAWLLWRAY